MIFVRSQWGIWRQHRTVMNLDAVQLLVSVHLNRGGQQDIKSALDAFEQIF